jgi:hypothetical protein
MHIGSDTKASSCGGATKTACGRIQWVHSQSWVEVENNILQHFQLGFCYIRINNLDSKHFILIFRNRVQPHFPPLQLPSLERTVRGYFGEGGGGKVFSSLGDRLA